MDIFYDECMKPNLSVRASGNSVVFSITVMGLLYPSVLLSGTPLLTRLAGVSFRNGGRRSTVHFQTGSSFCGKSEKIGVLKCLIHGVGGGRGRRWFWEGVDGGDNNYFAFTKGIFRKARLLPFSVSPLFVLGSIIFPEFLLSESISTGGSWNFKESNAFNVICLVDKSFEFTLLPLNLSPQVQSLHQVKCQMELGIVTTVTLAPSSFTLG